MYLLDTNVVSELRKARTGKADARVAAWAQATPASAMFLSAISVLELELGILLVERRDGAQAALLRAWLDQHVLPAFEGRILPVDTAVARRSEEHTSELQSLTNLVCRLLLVYQIGRAHV